MASDFQLLRFFFVYGCLGFFKIIFLGLFVLVCCYGFGFFIYFLGRFFNVCCAGGEFLSCNLKTKGHAMTAKGNKLKTNRRRHISAI